jgi:hypothetical protein
MLPPPGSHAGRPLAFLFQGREHPRARAPISEMASGPARERSESPCSDRPLLQSSPLPWMAPFCLPPPGAVLVRRLSRAPELLPLECNASPSPAAMDGRPGFCQLHPLVPTHGNLHALVAAAAALSSTSPAFQTHEGCCCSRPPNPTTGTKAVVKEPGRYARGSRCPQTHRARLLDRQHGGARASILLQRPSKTIDHG